MSKVLKTLEVYHHTSKVSRTLLKLPQIVICLALYLVSQTIIFIFFPFLFYREAALNAKDEQIDKLKEELHELVDRSISRGSDECDSMKKTLDVFISYRRSNGSQLASLLKVYLESRQFSVFLDIDRFVIKSYFHLSLK